MSMRLRNPPYLAVEIHRGFVLSSFQNHSFDTSRFSHCFNKRGDPHAGKIAGKYHLIKPIGKGGSGIVYLAEDLTLGKKWAVKEVPEEKAEETGGVLLLKDLDHPGIVRVADRFTENGMIYTVMDHIEGTRLDRYRKEKQIRPEEAARLTIQILKILDYLHTRQPPVIFRDLKPTNMILTADGSIRLFDFDAAVPKNALESPMRGTRGFAAPEQFRGKSSERSDLYAAGMCLRFLLPDRYCENNRNSLSKIVLKATEEREENRFQTAGEMKAALVRAAAELHPFRKRSVQYLAAAVLVLILLHFTRTGVDAALGRQYRKRIAEKDYIAAIDLRPSDENNYLELLRQSEKEQQTEEGIRLILLLRENYPEETAGHRELLVKIGKLYLTGSVFDPSFKKNPSAAKQFFTEALAAGTAENPGENRPADVEASTKNPSADTEVSALLSCVRAEQAFSGEIDWKEIAADVEILFSRQRERAPDEILRENVWLAGFLLNYREELAPFLGEIDNTAEQLLDRAEEAKTLLGEENTKEWQRKIDSCRKLLI